MDKTTPIEVYQLGKEVPCLLRPFVRGMLTSERLRSLRELCVPEHACIFNRGVYRGKGQHLPNRLSLMLAHGYESVRSIEEDFPYIDAALILLDHSSEGEVTIAPAPGNERGLENLAERFNSYREMRGVKPDVHWEEAA